MTTVFPAGHLDVSMAATNLENQLHSAQKNLLFLQREHASTLKGLHAEIRRLQQHCTGTSRHGQGRAAGAAMAQVPAAWAGQSCSCSHGTGRVWGYEDLD